MKKITSLLLALVSTTFLLAGATQAAEKFDHLSRSTISVANDSMTDMAPPCLGGDPTEDPTVENNP